MGPALAKGGKLRWGVLGAARINRALLPVLHRSPHNQPVAVASRDPARAQAEAARWGVPRAHGSYEALLADAEVDVVYIPLPNALHAEWTVRALRAGKHVLCEKPLVLSPPEMDAVEGAARETGGVVAEAFMYRHHPQTRLAREIVQGGRLGPVALVRGGFSFELQREGDVRRVAALGGGALWDIGCYPVSFARYVLGEEPARAAGVDARGESGVDEGFAGSLAFPGGALFTFDCSFRAAFRTFMEFVGPRGRLVVPQPFKPGVRERLLLECEGQAETLEVEGPEPYAGEVEDLAEAVHTGRAPEVSLTESRGNLQALLLLREAVAR